MSEQSMAEYESTVGDDDPGPDPGYEGYEPQGETSDEPPSDPKFKRVGYRFLGSIAGVSGLLVAISRAKAKFKEIIKSKPVSYPVKNKKTGVWETLSFQYAPLAAIDSATREALAAEGVGISFGVTRENEHRIDVYCWVAGNGAIIESVFRLYGDQCSDIKQVGASTTYIRRYATQMVLNIEGDVDADDVSDTPALAGPRRGQQGSGPSTPRRQESPPREPAREPQRATRGPAPQASPEPSPGRPIERQEPRPQPAPERPAEPASAPKQRAEAEAAGLEAWRTRVRADINEVLGKAKLSGAQYRAMARQALGCDPPRGEDMTNDQLGQLWDHIRTVFANLVPRSDVPESVGV